MLTETQGEMCGADRNFEKFRVLFCSKYSQELYITGVETSRVYIQKSVRLYEMLWIRLRDKQDVFEASEVQGFFY